jgi:beta-N-acetylhexosaminidase
MQAITKNRSIEEATVAAVRAGADLAMIAIGSADPRALTARLVDAVSNGSLDAERLADAAGRVRALAAALQSRTRQPGLDGAPIREVATRVVASQTLPALGGAPYVVDLTQGVHPAWNPYFSGLPEIFGRIAPGSEGIVVRGEHRLLDGAGAQSEGAIERAAAAATGRPLVIAVQDAVRTPWMREALATLLHNRGENTVVLCTGIPEDKELVPEGVATGTTSGRNLIVLEAVARALTRDGS